VHPKCVQSQDNKKNTQASCWNPCTQTFHNNVFNHKTTKKGPMLEVMHPDFPQNNLFRCKTTNESTMLQPMHFLLTKYSFYRMGPGNHFHGSFDTVILSLEILKLSPQNLISKNKKNCERKLKKILEISIFRVTSSK
jgi:hypothetical protein